MNDSYMQPDIVPMQPMMADPFSMAGGGVMPPNTTVRAENPQLIDSLLSNKGVNSALMDEFFWAFLNDNSMTFLDQDRKDAKLLAYDIIKINMLNTMHFLDYDLPTEAKWNIVRNIFETKLDRSLGTTNPQQMNERKAQNAMFSESRQISQHEDSQSYQKENFIYKLLKKRSG